MQEILGHVRSLWSYPVKSMVGSSASSLSLDARGVVGDRLYALSTLQGKFGSGKDSNRFQHIPGLLQFRSNYAGDVPVITFPNGMEVRGDAPEINALLSSELGLPVRLTREAEVSHLDAGPVHLLSHASLQELATELGIEHVGAERFRPNIVMDLEPGIAPENMWIGARLQLGSEVQLTITEPTERCVMTGQAQLNFPKAPKILKHLVKHCRTQFGVYAEVTRPGTLELNATIRRI